MVLWYCGTVVLWYCAGLSLLFRYDPGSVMSNGRLEHMGYVTEGRLQYPHIINNIATTGNNVFAPPAATINQRMSDQ